MEIDYGIAHTFSIVEGVLVKTPIGYVIGVPNMVAYNNNNTESKIEQAKKTIPQNLQEI
jgi:hypothetical protein